MSTDSENPEEFRIGDPEDISQAKRIHELLSRRSGVIDARDAATDALAFGEADEQTAKSYYQSRIESLIIDLWTKFENSDMESGQEYLESADIDTVQVPPPEELLPSSDGDMAAGEDVPDPKAVTIQGLQWFIDNEPVVAAEFTAYTWNPPGERTVPNHRMLPWSTLDRALIMCMKFIDETGIDADLQVEEGDAGFDYEDILEDGPPGRGDSDTDSAPPNIGEAVE